MSRYTNLPTLAVDFLKPLRRDFDTPGGGLSGGRNSYGQGLTAEFSGGPVVVGAYEECSVQSPEEHEYASWVAARCNGRFRFVNVPIKTDWEGPFARDLRGFPQVAVKTTHSDGTTFSDGSSYWQPTVWGEITEGAALNAGIVKLQLFGAGRLLRHTDWFSIYHEDKGWRAYRYWEVRDIDNPEAESPVYTLALEIPLREAVAVGQRAEFARPRCAMKFPDGFTLKVPAEGFWMSSPTLRFTEAF